MIESETTDDTDGRPNTERATSSRRMFLKGAGALGVGLAACSNSDGSQSSDSTAGTSTDPPNTDPVTTDDAPPTGPPVTDPPESDPAEPTTPTMAAGKFPDITKRPENWNQPAPWVPRENNQLCLSVVENQHGLLFSWHGTTPGPTVRMRGDQTLRVRVENGLGPDAGLSTVGPSPGAIGAPAGPFPGPEGQTINAMFKSDPASVYGGTPEAPIINMIPTSPREDWCLGEHVNGVHSAHVTNLHTHGLHVTSGKNDNGTHSDNIYLRIVPSADWDKMLEDPECVQQYQEALSLKEGEIVDSQADFEFILGRTAAVPIHPPGTHWYHPHSHGSTHNQVSSGMAGFLIIEGDVDERVNQALAGVPAPDPGVPTGPYEYRERTMFIQRVFNNPSTDPDRDRTNLIAKQTGSTNPKINGEDGPTLIKMRPGTIERWRVLNGSVDGSGFLRVMVLAGRFELQGSGAATQFVLVDDAGGDKAQIVTEDEFGGTMTIGDGNPESITDRKCHLWQLSRDGVTLVTNSEDDPKYFVKDLDLDNQEEPSFKHRDECYQGENAKLCYNRPNEVALADANRADIFFQAPESKSDVDPPTQVYTVIGMPTALHATSPNVVKPPTIIAHVIVQGQPVKGRTDDGAPFDFTTMPMPPVPDYLYPIPAAELAITDAEQQNGQAAGFRSRTIRYAGWGHASSPRIDVPQSEVDANPLLDKLLYYQSPPPDTPGLMMPDADGKPQPISDLRRFGPPDFPTVVAVPNTRTMSINGHKFEPTSDETPVMWVDTAEEWVIYNESVEAYAIDVPKTVTEKFAIDNEAEQVWYTYKDSDGTQVDPKAWGNPAAHPMWATDVPAANDKRAEAGLAPLSKVLTGGADHPFHIHQNPFWLMRLEVPNDKGELVNVIDAPFWADVTFLPRNGGRAVFRSRFVDYVGEYVNHCHILLHEDNGMMQRIQVLAPPGDDRFNADKPAANYDVVDQVVTFEMSSKDVNDVHLPPTPVEMYRRSASFVDDNASGQVFPLPSGWIPEPPPL